MSDAGASWTNERVSLLARLWADGKSASQIAAEMGGVSRNAVIGKVHRLGLSGRGKSKSAPAQAPRRNSEADAPTASPAPPARDQSQFVAPTLAVAGEENLVIAPRDEVGLPLSERVTIMELRESMCRWPLGDPTKADFRYCGARSAPGVPYCGHHCTIAYQPVVDRRRDRRLLRA